MIWIKGHLIQSLTFLHSPAQHLPAYLSCDPLEIKMIVNSFEYWSHTRWNIRSFVYIIICDIHCLVLTLYKPSHAPQGVLGSEETCSYHIQLYFYFCILLSFYMGLLLLKSALNQYSQFLCLILHEFEDVVACFPSCFPPCLFPEWTVFHHLSWESVLSWTMLG